MEKQRNRYTEEFKKRTVKYILEQTKTMPEIEQELGISAGVLHSWKQQYRSEIEVAEQKFTPDLVHELEEQLRSLKLEQQKKERENEELREEVEILKKALHIFGKEKN